jgi:hypothetical protein
MISDTEVRVDAIPSHVWMTLSQVTCGWRYPKSRVDDTIPSHVWMMLSQVTCGWHYPNSRVDDAIPSHVWMTLSQVTCGCLYPKSRVMTLSQVTCVWRYPKSRVDDTIPSTVCIHSRPPFGLPRNKVQLNFAKLKSLSSLFRISRSIKSYFATTLVDCNLTINNYK